METIFLYIAKVNIALAVFYLLYVLLLRNDTFIKLRRYYFLSTIIFSLSYPLFTVATLGNLIDFSQKVPETEVSVMMGDISMGELIVDKVEIEEITTATIPWTDVVKNILLVGVLFFSLRFLWQLFSIVRIKWRSEKITLFGQPIYHLTDEIIPFSFFSWIFIHTEKHSDEELKQILLHEQTHVHQRHSLDVMLVEIVRILFWYNPIVWLMKRDITINLEYLADNAVLQEGINTREYQYHLLQLTYHETAVQIVNNFNVPQLKQRIMMMNSKKSPMRKLAKYLSVLPLALLLITANSVYAQQNVTQPEPVKIESKDSDEKSKYHEVTENLDKLAATLKSEIKYPQTAKESGIEGDVIASFIVEEDGSVTNPKILKATDPLFNTESIRVISSMPKLKQFTYIVDGEPLRIKYTGQFTFRLEGKKTSRKVRIGGYTVLSIADRTGDDKPLFIVDGVKMGKAFDINSLNESDIEHRTIYQKEAATATYGEEGKNGAVLITLKKENTPPRDQKPVKKESKSDEVFVVVEEQPSFKEGVKAMMNFIESEMKYPVIAKEKGIQGRVIVNYIVEKDGSITNPQIVRGVDPSLDKEAIRIIEAMPKWNPGLQRDERVRVKYTLPISFKLDENKDSSEMTTASIKILKDKEGEEVIVRGYGSMKDLSPQTLAEKFGDKNPLYIIDDVKMDDKFDLNNIKPEDIESISVLKDKSALDIYGDKGKNGVIIIKTKPTPKGRLHVGTVVTPSSLDNNKGEDEVFMVVEVQPEFPGGMQALMKFLGDNIKYPEEAQKNKIQGRVIVNFVVNKDGSLSDFKVVRGQDPLLDAEAIRVISTMPNWKPGMQRGQTVKVRYTLPIVFRLNEDKEVESENIKMLLGKPSIVSRRDQKTDRKFYEFISQRIKYPVIAQEKGITGVVRASYDVNSSGIVSNIKITKGADPSLDAELKRIIQLMPNDIALMRSEGKAASNVAISANFIFGDAKMKEVRSEESDFIVMGYSKATE